MTLGRELGVLFVHGIGEPSRGQTVTLWGDALSEWCEGWLGGGSTRFLGGHLVGDPDDSSAPAHVDLMVAVPRAGDEPVESQWRIAESWWAESFGPPRLREVAMWTFRVLPFALISHVWARVEITTRRRGDGALARSALVWRWTLALGQLVLAMVLAPLAAAVVVLMLVLTALPLNVARQLGAAMQRALAQVIGDSYVLLLSPSRAAAVVHQVEHDLRWLDESRDAVVVVAHSQGAEVAHRAIRRTAPQHLAAFVTLGTGQTKLTAIEGVTRSGGVGAVWWAPVGAAVFALGAFGLVWALVTQGVTQEVGGAALYVAVGLGITGAGVEVARRHANPSVTSLGVPASWSNLHASHDPVSNGPLSPGTDVLVASSEVSNRGSAVTDHTTYHRNAEEVLARIAGACATAAGGTILRDPEDDLVLAVAQGRRAWRVRWLRRARLFSAVAAVAVLVLNRSRLDDVGEAVGGSSAIRRLLAGLGWRGEDAAAPLAGLVTGAGALLALVLVGHLVLLALWRGWDRDEARLMFAREEFRIRPARCQAMMWTAGSIAAAVVLGSGLVSVHAEFGEDSSAGWMVGALMGSWFAGALVALLLDRLGVIADGVLWEGTGMVGPLLLTWSASVVGAVVSSGSLRLVLATAALVVVPFLAPSLGAVLASNASVHLRRARRRRRAYAGPVVPAAVAHDPHGGPAEDDRLALLETLAGDSETSALDVVDYADLLRWRGHPERGDALLEARAGTSVDVALALLRRAPASPVARTRLLADDLTWWDRRRARRALSRADAPQVASLGPA